METGGAESYSLPLKIYAKIVGEEVGNEMKTNRDLLKDLKEKGKIDSLITTLGDEEYSQGPTPKFLFTNQLEKFSKMLNDGRFDSAVNYVQTFSGGYGQKVLHSTIDLINTPQKNPA